MERRIVSINLFSIYARKKFNNKIKNKFAFMIIIRIYLYIHYAIIFE